MAYPPGRFVLAQMVVRRERWPGGYRARGVPLVSPGQKVAPDSPALRLEREDIPDLLQLPGALSLPTVNTRTRIAVVRSVETAEGHAGESGNPAASAQDKEGTFVPSGLHGRVVGITQRGGVVIESYAVVMRGALGVGHQVAGPLAIWQASSAIRGPQILPPGAILVVPGPVNFLFLRQALASSVSGVIASSITLRDLEGFLRADLISLLTSPDAERMQDHLPPLTIFLTEGVGNATMPPRILNLFNQCQGTVALLSGSTSLRQHILPELLISSPIQEAQHQQTQSPNPPLTRLVTGTPVRIVSGEYEGRIGIVDYLFTHQQLFPSGIRAAAARLRLEDGSLLVVPLALIERIE
jgi:hypothetical protein